ncbi:hydroxysqualene dehydroxylase HpnE [Xenophilus arseniciresistens]|uniref:Hydroxysqualene dehydroxylase HpnE n=1 Tax=Xenophilus arseniciresistens TaxID=1283306 RepID=A0AAE3NAG2_9BURK|nr:hydroxysqualene dehydroxylase HpnE [Xenophilus arseniciresistens]MDA7417564.1 hydroxysqualene dehydroxylase HpnE [Xenophilus arseniciresistens]
MSTAALRTAVIGAGWAGLAAAVRATQAGQAVTLYEAARTPGGRARRVLADDGTVLDNGQHILIGAYRATLALMREVGVSPEATLRRLPLALRFADGGGLEVPAGLRPPLDLLAGICAARGWTWADRYSLLRTSLQWRLRGFACAPTLSVAQLCAALTPRVMTELIEPLCVSALNVPPARASAQVFLRVLRDALFGEAGGADLLLPRVDLGALLPDAALDWLAARRAQQRLGHRVQSIARDGARWLVDSDPFDRVLLATPVWESARLVQQAALPEAADWLARAQAIDHEAIATVYVKGAPPLPQGRPMLALRSDAQRAPAQFVFDRAQLDGPAGLAAFVVSASTLPREELQARVLAQAKVQLNWTDLQPLQTIVEKRATFACTPGLQRPAMDIAPGLRACGDCCEGPYPATLEGAVLSGEAAARP